MLRKYIFYFIIIFLLFAGILWGKTNGTSWNNPAQSNEKKSYIPELISSVIQFGNQVIQVQVGSDGCFNIGTADGTTLTFDFPKSPWSSHTNVSIDGTIYGNKEYGWNRMSISSYPELSDNTLTCSWEVQNITIEQSLIPEAYSDTTGAILIKYVITNNDNVKHDVGLLLELDTMIGDNDHAPLFARANYCSIETKFTGSDIPDYYQAWERNDINNHGVISQGTLRGGNAVCPDVFIVGDWTRLKLVPWDYNVQNRGYGDSAVILRWNPVTLSPGDSTYIATYYGIGNVKISPGVLSLSLTAPDFLEVIDDSLTPNPFDVNLLITNMGGTIAQNVEASIVLPSFLLLDSNEVATKTVNPYNILPGNSSAASWRVFASVPPQDTCLTIMAIARSANTDSNSVSREICVPTIMIEPDTVPIFMITDSIHVASDEFWLDICMGDSIQPLNKLYETSFTLHYDTAWIDTIAPFAESIVPGNLWQESNDAHITYPFEVTGDSLVLKVRSSVSDSSVSGIGSLLRIRLRLRPETPDTALCFSITSTVAIDSSGNPIQLIPEDYCMTVRSLVNVWPGDTNNDGIVNQADILPIGVFWNQTGFSRIGYSNSTMWEVQLCYPWAEDERSTYTDANGDSVINQNDVLVVGLNWDKSHILNKKSVNQLTDIYDSGLMKMIVIKDSSEELYHLSFAVEYVEYLLGMGVELIYPSGGITINSIHSGDFFGKSPLLFYKDDKPNGILSIAVTRIGEQGGISGSGCVFAIQMEMESCYNPAMIDVRQAVGMDETGHQFDFEIESLDVNSDIDKIANLPDTYNIHQNYPNPFNPVTTIKYELSETAYVSIIVYDILGGEVSILVSKHQTAGIYKVIWDGRDKYGKLVSSGIYYFQMQVDEFSCVRKGLLLK
jgi:hypothetical protein